MTFREKIDVCNFFTKRHKFFGRVRLELKTSEK